MGAPLYPTIFTASISQAFLCLHYQSSKKGGNPGEKERIQSRKGAPQGEGGRERNGGRERKREIIFTLWDGLACLNNYDTVAFCRLSRSPSCHHWFTRGGKMTEVEREGAKLTANSRWICSPRNAAILFSAPHMIGGTWVDPIRLRTARFPPRFPNLNIRLPLHQALIFLRFKSLPRPKIKEEMRFSSKRSAQNILYFQIWRCLQLFLKMIVPHNLLSFK